MAYTINVLTGKPDAIGKNDINGIQIGDADTYFNWVAPDTLQLLVNGQVVHSWTVPVSTGGNPMGAWLFWTPIGQ